MEGEGPTFPSAERAPGLLLDGTQDQGGGAPSPGSVNLYRGTGKQQQQQQHDEVSTGHLGPDNNAKTPSTPPSNAKRDAHHSYNEKAGAHFSPIYENAAKNLSGTSVSSGMKEFYLHTHHEEDTVSERSFTSMSSFGHSVEEFHAEKESLPGSEMAFRAPPAPAVLGHSQSDPASPAAKNLSFRPTKVSFGSLRPTGNNSIRLKASEPAAPTNSTVRTRTGSLGGSLRGSIRSGFNSLRERATSKLPSFDRTTRSMHPSLRKSLKTPLPDDVEPLASINPYENPLVDALKLQAAMEVDSKAEARRDAIAEHLAWDNAAAAAPEALIRMCRAGVVPSKRVGVWLKAAHGGAPGCGTPRHLRKLEGDYRFLLEKAFPQPGELEEADGLPPPVFGGRLVPGEHCLTAGAARDVGRVLRLLQHAAAVEYCPLLPALVPLLLTFLPPAAAHDVAHQMVRRRPQFFPCSAFLTRVWLLTFRDLLGLCFPKTAAHMAAIGADADAHLEALFHRLFLPVLPAKFVFRIADSWLAEGAKVLHRYGLGLVGLFKRRLKRLRIADGEDFWDQLREFASDEDFTFQALHRAAYGRFRGNPLTRALIESLNQKNELVVKDQAFAAAGGGGGAGGAGAPSAGPGLLGVGWEEEAGATRPLRVAGARPSRLLGGEGSRAQRARLAAWVPRRFRDLALELVFSTDVDGYNLAHLYAACGGAAPNLMVVRGQPQLGPGPGAAARSFVVGSFNTHPWAQRAGHFGNEECFLFALEPRPKVLRWAPPELAALAAAAAAAGGGRGSRGSSGAGSGGGGRQRAWSEGSAALALEAEGDAREAPKFLMATREFMGMGFCSRSGGFGLLLDKDLQSGSTQPCQVYGMEPLVESEVELPPTPPPEEEEGEEKGAAELPPHPPGPDQAHLGRGGGGAAVGGLEEGREGRSRKKGHGVVDFEVLAVEVFRFTHCFS